MLSKKINIIIYTVFTLLNSWLLLTLGVSGKAIIMFLIIIIINQLLLTWVVRRAMLGNKLSKRHFIAMVAKFFLLVTAFFLVVKYQQPYILQFVFSYTFQLLILLISIKSNYKFKEKV